MHVTQLIGLPKLTYHQSENFTEYHAQNQSPFL